MDITAHKVNLDSVLKKANELKISEDKKIAAGPRAKQQHHAINKKAKVNQQNMKLSSTLKKQPLPARQYLNKGQFYIHQARPSFSSPFFPPPMYNGDKYHWVRGADLVRA